MADFTVWDTVWLVYIATAMQVLGLLITKQIMLRILVLIGSIFYVLFAYFHLSEPLWAAVYGSALIGLANLIGLSLLIYSRVPIGMTETERAFFDALGKPEPGVFRRLLAKGHIKKTDLPLKLTQEGDVPDKLYFVLTGQVEVQKGDASFVLHDQCFVGEVAYLSGVNASGSARLLQGGLYIEWDCSRLKKATKKSPVLRQTLEALISRDLATKVATGVQTSNLRVADKSPIQIRHSTSATA